MHIKIKFFKKSHSFRKNPGEINPYPYWSFIFFLGFFLTITAFVFGFLLFKKINKEFISSPIPATEQAKAIDKERIAKVLEYFSAKKQESMRILHLSSGVIDPSL